MLGILSQRIQLRVQCVKHDPKTGRIVQIGGVDSLGSAFRYSEDQAIAMIRANTHHFYTYEAGVRAEVEVARMTLLGNDFLKTVPDGLHPNNLSKLPTCSW
jgi:hypothetical protein